MRQACAKSQLLARGTDGRNLVDFLHSSQGASLRIRVNGTERDVTAAPDTPLLYVLHNELALNGPKFGCGVGQCGSCTVHVDGAPRRSCNTPLSDVAGKSVVTLEGLGTPDRPHPLQQAFVDEQAAQCGYCINGMIMRAAALLERTPRPTREQITSALSANLCRCGTHMRIVRAVERAAAARSSE
jgi:nicotinate dehydrogenase subunit A